MTIATMTKSPADPILVFSHTFDAPREMVWRLDGPGADLALVGVRPHHQHRLRHGCPAGRRLAGGHA